MYQIKQAKSYVLEQLNANGNYTFEFIKIPDIENLIRVKINSRHLSQTIYNTFIKFENTNNGSPNFAWYCDCKAGARVLEACAHVTSIIWYLGYARHYPNLLKLRKSDSYYYLCEDAGSN